MPLRRGPGGPAPFDQPGVQGLDEEGVGAQGAARRRGRVAPPGWAAAVAGMSCLTW
ncbi:hypothetical protein SMD44_02746 [Streptomyces alboflavus]|uniref:Uncharacterized protein n=1 Tax=Streptomyces alboflavus TaxID=67267 RepID=A0A1Z1WAB4_9ACTN|nr:hypothetical protein SMD44_02746 [Streptomyces alboflavus]